MPIVSLGARTDARTAGLRKAVAALTAGPAIEAAPRNSASNSADGDASQRMVTELRNGEMQARVLDLLQRNGKPSQNHVRSSTLRSIVSGALAVAANDEGDGYAVGTENGQVLVHLSESSVMLCEGHTGPVWSVRGT